MRVLVALQQPTQHVEQKTQPEVWVPWERTASGIRKDDGYGLKRGLLK
jgi:hypothetical protein